MSKVIDDLSSGDEVHVALNNERIVIQIDGEHRRPPIEYFAPFSLDANSSEITASVDYATKILQLQIPVVD